MDKVQDKKPLTEESIKAMGNAVAVKTYFGMTLDEMKREFSDLPAADKEELAVGSRRALIAALPK
jgi:hypothetical protein